MDNGPIVTGASPGKLRQLNGNGHVFIGKENDLLYQQKKLFREIKNKKFKLNFTKFFFEKFHFQNVFSRNFFYFFS